MNSTFPCLYKNPSKSTTHHLFHVMPSNPNLYSNLPLLTSKEKSSPNQIDVTLNSSLSSYKILIKIKFNGNSMIKKFKNKASLKSHKIKAKSNPNKNSKSKSASIPTKSEIIITNFPSSFTPKKLSNLSNMLMSS